LIHQFTFDYTDKNRQSLKSRYKDAQGFVAGFAIDDATFNEFIAFAEKSGIKKDENGITLSGEKIRTYLKANIGRNEFGDEAYYPVIEKTDNTLNKAINVLDTLK